jgi:aspartate oxidase
MLKADGFDEAVMGMASIWRDGSKVDVLVYDGNKMIAILKKDGMTYDEAIDFIEFNVEGAYVGIETPVVVWPYLDEE